MKKFKKLVSSILITMLTVATLGSISAVKAASAGPLYLGIVSLRRAGYGYQQEGSKVWKIAEYDSENGKTADLSKTIYCIKGGPGFGSSDMATGGVPTISKYTQKFNLKDLASIPSTYSKILPTGSNYNSLMWLLDNIYIMPAIGTDNTTAREEFLKSKIPNELYELITDDDIDAVQQLAIWYFTNPSGDKYHYETSNFKINSIANVDSNYASMGDIFGDDGWDREDAIEALFQYYITNAKANSNYKSTNNTTSPIEIVKSNATMTKVGSNYVAGPYKINQLLNVDYTLNATFTDINGTTITPSIGIKDVSGNVTATTKTLKELVGQEFYLIMPTSSNISGIKMTVNTSYTSKTVDYWSVADAPTTEQPVVIVNETPLNFSDATSIVVPKPFDLSLRKFITNINGTEITNRIPQVDVSKLASGEATTATYNHTKTPLKVAIGDVVTYTIRVYNEGDIDGYVEEITDHLPDQLEFIVDDQVNIEYGWKIASSTDLKTIKTEYLSKANETTDGANKISAFNGTTLAYKDVKIKCRVVATDPMADKITNIADITKFTDGDGNTVTDRDSQENNVNLPTGKDLENYKDSEINRGEEYIPGQQDDDDFEKLTLKEFDLSLRKFITGVNGTAITNREPQVNVTPLKNGGTTAIYNHPKTPVSVAIGDLVEYTIRVYNEAEIDGYVEEITDHLPDQLEFVAGNEINTKYGWVVDSTNSKIIRTNYLSKAKEASEGANKIKAFDGTKLDYKDVKVVCKVISTDPMPTKITNIADITKFTDGNGNKVTDRDSQENNVNIPSDLPGYKDDEIGKDYVPGQQDDDDFEKLKIKEFDLALRKFITKLNDEEITSRIPQPDVSKLADGTATTATYNHPKTPISVAIGDVVEYTIRVYNEAEVDGYVEEITDHLPDQLEFVAGNETNTKYGWTVDSNNSKIIKTKYLSKANETTEGDNKIKAFDGTKLDYKDVKVVCKVVSTDPMPTKITNIADITKFTDGNGNTVTDRDSQENNVNIPSDLPGYKDDEIGKDYVPGQQDDDDFEKLKIKEFDLALRKFITKVNNTEIKSRIPQVDTTPLKNGTGTTAIYNHSKEPVKVSLGAVVEYTIRVYNEGQVNGYVEEIKDHLPDQLEFIKDNETNKKYGWIVDSTDSKVIKTSYLCKANEKVAGENKIPAFDGTTLSYKEVKVACKVVSTDPMPSKITNLADISDFTDGEGNKVTDRDSKEDNVKIPEDRPGYKDDESKKDYVPGQEDDDDFEKVTLVKFDLSLRKFITAVNNTEITSRIPQVDVTPIKDGSSTTAKYDHPKDPVLVSNGNIVTYTIRVFNEGEMDGYASEIKDDMPQGLKFLTDNKTNIEYRWKMLDKDGKETEKLDEAVSIVTDYLSKEQEKTAGANLLKAFDGEKLDYRDVKVAFEVTEPNTSDRILINQAQISKDSDKDGNDVTDQDSVPDKWNEGEDDQDIEKVKVQYFDLSLRKWVTQAIVTENGEEKIIESGHKAEDDPEDVVKVDLKKSKINKVTIKFRYKIRVKNEGNIAGYAKELKDYIPNGLKFVPEDNPLWKQIDEKTITTDQTKDILLQPGDTTEVEVVLTWINDSENFGVMDNWAEISKDHNDFNSPDIDSTPDNNKKGEDDIDDAPVSVGVQTGQIKTFTTIGLAVLVILSSGVVLIKKFVL
ncbi:MAG: Cys-Gln thioester bond-forming surface protein [Clostridia bacterium]